MMTLSTPRDFSLHLPGRVLKGFEVGAGTMGRPGDLAQNVEQLYLCSRWRWRLRTGTSGHCISGCASLLSSGRGSPGVADLAFLYKAWTLHSGSRYRVCS